MSKAADSNGHEPEDRAALDRLAFREAMSRLAAAVSIVTTDGPAGRRGFTASAVASVCDTPPTLLVCLNRASGTYAVFAANGVLCVNILNADQERIGRVFAGLEETGSQDRFETGRWRALKSGAPALEGARVSVDCRIVSRTDVGTHTVFFAQAVAASFGSEGPPLLYIDRGFTRLQPE